MPVSVMTERFDILAWNAAYGALFPRTAEVPVGRAEHAAAGLYPAGLLQRDREPGRAAAAMVAQLRAAYGHHVGDPAWTGFIRRMEAASPEFAAMWATQDVAHRLTTPRCSGIRSTRGWR